MKKAKQNNAEPCSSNHRFLLNLTEMLDLVSEGLWQKSGSKYFITFKLFGLSAKMAIWL